ncbi:MAG: sigma-54 dependent transcriptional regulator [Acidobacteriota bacterium]
MNPFEKICAADPKTQEVVALARRVASSASTVLIEGESGVGKDLLANAMHYASDRAEGPYVRIDCPNLTEELVECELFGYEPGAFTDARGRKKGKFELADKGTLYIDGIDHLSLVLQAKLLRPLQEKVVQRLGSTVEHELDVRIIASSQLDVAEEVRVGAFRSDLFFRLAVVHIKVPPLRQRRADIGLLAKALAREAGVRTGRPAFDVSEEAVAVMKRYSWPGNVREMKNVLERLAMTCSADQAGADEMLAVLPALGFGTDSRPLTLREVEFQYIEEILDRTGHNVTTAAGLLGISRKAVYDHLRRTSGRSV